MITISEIYVGSGGAVVWNERDLGETSFEEALAEHNEHLTYWYGVHPDKVITAIFRVTDDGTTEV